MVLSRCASALVVLTVGFAVVASAQTAEKTFPTVAEINLVLTQTERAIEQYKPLIDMEAVHVGKSGADTIAHDREVVSALEMAIKATVHTPITVDFGEDGGWAPAGAADGSEPQSVSRRGAAAVAICMSV